MKCPGCQTENPDTQKFCGECGRRLEKECPNCGVANPPHYKFCGECGHSLRLPSEASPKALSLDEKLDKIQRYLPKGLTEKILAQRDRIEGEHKQVTIMFCDMKGFTPLTEKLGPEETFSLMDQVFEILIHKVHDYQGIVNELRGDGILALFGAPLALEDAPQRAIRSSLAIHREMAKFNEKFKVEEDVPSVLLRIGINTGPVVVGTVGNDLRVQFTVVGDTINMASRMEGLAEPGTTYVSEETFKLTEGFFRFEALGKKAIKGKKEPVNVYRVIAPSTRRTRFDVSAERGLAPFIGREKELALLMDAFERAKAGRGQAISITSEAGLGKSRLLYEFRKAVANEDITFLEGKCLSYSRGVAYHPVIDILKSNFNVQEDEDDSTIREKVRYGLNVLDADETKILPYLLELLSVKDSGIDKIMMSPEGKRDRIIGALKRIVLKGSEIRPLIMAFEDLHWIDRSSEEVLKYVLESIPGSRILLLFTHRPEFAHSWGAKSYHSQVTLNRLSNRESLTMVAQLLDTKNLDAGLEELILEKVEGVPFFIEEFVRSLTDLKIIERDERKCSLTKNVQEITVPSTIQDIIMARVDSLPEGAKELLQIGSVIEREFSYPLIRQVTTLQEKELLSHLSILKGSELLYERGIHPQSTYVFKHALTQKVIYDSILMKKKKQLHWEIGNAIEELYKGNIDEYYEVLTEHYINSENYKKGAEYSKLAAKKAEDKGSLTDAIEYAKKRISSLERQTGTDDLQMQIIDARTTLGLYYSQINYFVEAKKTIDPINDLPLGHTPKRRLSQLYTIIGTYNFMVEEDFSKAFEQLENSLNICKEIDDCVSLLFASFWFGSALCLACRFEEALDKLEKAIDISMAANNLWGTSIIKSIQSVFVYHFQGMTNLAYQTSYDAIRLAEKSGDIASKSWAYVSHGICCYGKGLLQEATEHLLKGADFCERNSLFHCNALAQNCLGEIFFEVEEYQKSKSRFQKAIWLLRKNRSSSSWMHLNGIALALAKIMVDEKDIDLDSVYVYALENKLKSYEGLIRRYIGEILLNLDELHTFEAEEWIKRAIDADKGNGMKWFFARDHIVYAKLFRRIGDASKAKENLNDAIEIFKECNADGWVKIANKELASVS